MSRPKADEKAESAPPAPSAASTSPSATNGAGDGTKSPRNSADLLRLFYDELRQLARARMARERRGGAGMTLDPTGLVHEAYLRIAADHEGEPSMRWANRGHFFGAAALAMRRILVERARFQGRLKHGGGRNRVGLDDALSVAAPEGAGKTDLLALDEALTKLEQVDPRKAKVVELRYFGGLGVDETATALDVSPATVKNEWAFARAWLHREMTGEAPPGRAPGGAQTAAANDAAAAADAPRPPQRP